MTDTLSKIEKRTAYTLLLPAVFLVFAIVLFPIFANIWISFKEVQLKDIRIPEPRAKKIVKIIPEDKSKLRIVSRSSKLALKQVDIICQKIKHRFDFEIIKVQTQADKLREKPLYDFGGKGLFIKELDDYLI